LHNPVHETFPYFSTELPFGAIIGANSQGLMKIKNALVAVLVCLFALSPLAPAEKQLDWQVGTLRDSQRSRFFAGTVGDSNTNGNATAYGNTATYNERTDTSSTAVYRVYQTYEIEGDQYVYLAEQHIKWRWSKAADISVNGRVQYAVDKRKLYLVDEQRKIYELQIVKKILKTPQTAAK
jgi:hypothetical protein